MKKHEYLYLFLIILASATVANLVSLYIAAQVAQKKLSESTSGGSTVGTLLSLFSKPSA